MPGSTSKSFVASGLIGFDVKDRTMAFITTKVVIISSFVAAAGGGAGVMGYQNYTGDQHPAALNTATTASQTAAGPDWSREWYDIHKVIRDNATASVAIPSY
jgi:uncharacterized membrane protein YebE (DUF533 family)